MFYYLEGRKNILQNKSVEYVLKYVLLVLQSEKLIDVLYHYYSLALNPNQKIYVIDIDDYVYYVPFVENEKEIFLKIIIPSRKYKKQYNI